MAFRKVKVEYYTILHKSHSQSLMLAGRPTGRPEVGYKDREGAAEGEKAPEFVTVVEF